MPLTLTRTEWSIVIACIVSLLCGFFLGFISSEHTYPVVVRVPAVATQAPNPQLPHCTEDEIYLRGQGDFNGVTGQWSHYTCVHPDSIPTEQQVVQLICSNPERWYVEPATC